MSEKVEEEIVSVITTNDRAVEGGCVDSYLQYKHGITLNHEQIVSVSKVMKVEGDEYINYENDIESPFVFCYHDDYILKFKTEEDMCAFKLDHSNLLYSDGN